jgi:hypothetical protein
MIAVCLSRLGDGGLIFPGRVIHSGALAGAHSWRLRREHSGPLQAVIGDGGALLVRNHSPAMASRSARRAATCSGLGSPAVMT